jgi:hypothetical protein
MMARLIDLSKYREEDLNMGAIFNSKERTVNEWRALLISADPRFVLKGVTESEGLDLGILEVVWDLDNQIDPKALSSYLERK